MTWWERLRFARKVKGFTLREVERLTGISNPYLCQIEAGSVDEPSFFKIVKLMKLYNLNVEDLGV